MKQLIWTSMFCSMIFSLLIALAMLWGNERIYLKKVDITKGIQGGAHVHHDYQFDINGDTIVIYDENRQLGISIDTNIFRTEFYEILVKDNK